MEIVMKPSEKAKEVLRAAEIFRTGCSITDPRIDGNGDPTECEECSAEFLKHVSQTVGIRWQPFAEVPDRLKDGRPVLFWERDFGPCVYTWSEEGWTDHQGSIGRLVPTHFAEIQEPSDD